MNEKTLAQTDLRHFIDQSVLNSEIEGIQVTREQVINAHEKLSRMVDSGEDLAIARRIMGVQDQVKLASRGPASRSVPTNRNSMKI